MEDSRFKIEESNAEVKSFIYQQIQDLESFMTPNSIVNVASERVSGKEPDNNDYTHNNSTEKDLLFFKVVISITENSTVIDGTATSSNIFEAITLAKKNLYSLLIKIQDEVISREDREAQLIQAKNSIIH